MLGPFTTVSRTVAHHLRIDVHDANDNDDNVWQRGPLWPHGMDPTSWFRLDTLRPITSTVLEWHSKGNKSIGQQWKMDVETVRGWDEVNESHTSEADLADKLDFSSLDVFDDHDLHLGQEVQRQITHRIPTHHKHTPTLPHTLTLH